MKQEVGIKQAELHCWLIEQAGSLRRVSKRTRGTARRELNNIADEITRFADCVVDSMDADTLFCFGAAWARFSEKDPVPPGDEAILRAVHLFNENHDERRKAWRWNWLESLIVRDLSYRSIKEFCTDYDVKYSSLLDWVRTGRATTVFEVKFRDAANSGLQDDKKITGFPVLAYEVIDGL